MQVCVSAFLIFSRAFQRLPEPFWRASVRLCLPDLLQSLQEASRAVLVCFLPRVSASVRLCRIRLRSPRFRRALRRPKSESVAVRIADSTGARSAFVCRCRFTLRVALAPVQPASFLCPENDLSIPPCRPVPLNTRRGSGKAFPAESIYTQSVRVSACESVQEPTKSRFGVPLILSGVPRYSGSVRRVYHSPPFHSIPPGESGCRKTARVWRGVPPGRQKNGATASRKGQSR